MWFAHAHLCKKHFVPKTKSKVVPKKKFARCGHGRTSLTYAVGHAKVLKLCTHRAGLFIKSITLIGSDGSSLHHSSLSFLQYSFSDKRNQLHAVVRVCLKSLTKPLRKMIIKIQTKILTNMGNASCFSPFVASLLHCFH